MRIVVVAAIAVIERLRSWLPSGTVRVGQVLLSSLFPVPEVWEIPRRGMAKRSLRQSHASAEAGGAFESFGVLGCPESSSMEGNHDWVPSSHRTRRRCKYCQNNHFRHTCAIKVLCASSSAGAHNTLIVLSGPLKARSPAGSQELETLRQ